MFKWAKNTRRCWWGRGNRSLRIANLVALIHSSSLVCNFFVRYPNPFANNAPRAKNFSETFLLSHCKWQLYPSIKTLFGRRASAHIFLGGELPHNTLIFFLDLFDIHWATSLILRQEFANTLMQMGNPLQNLFNKYSLLWFAFVLKSSSVWILSFACGIGH